MHHNSYQIYDLFFDCPSAIIIDTITWLVETHVQRQSHIIDEITKFV